MGGVARLDEWDPKRGRGGRPYERLKRIIYQREICWICGKSCRYDVGPRHPMAPSVDHRTPLKMGGHPTALENAELAHYGCNSSRQEGRPDAAKLFYRPRSRDY